MRTIPGHPSILDRQSALYQRVCLQIRRFPFLPSSRRYNITVCREKRFVWFRVAKVGTRTIFQHFKRNHLYLDAEHPMFLYYPVKSYTNYFKFAFVRNPWDRLVSCWHNKVLGMNYFHFSEAQLEEMQKFSTFVEYVDRFDIENCDQHLRLQCRLIDLNQLDYLGRIERFHIDLAAIFKQIDLPYEATVRENVSTKRKQYQEYYTDELVEKVARIYRKDIQIFNYDF